jgi:hypothetical protein
MSPEQGESSALPGNLGRTLKHREDLTRGHAVDLGFVHSECYETPSLLETTAVLSGSGLAGTGHIGLLGLSPFAHDNVL